MRRNLGLTARAKLGYQALAAAAVAVALVVLEQFRMFSTQMNVPFIKILAARHAVAQRPHPFLTWDF